MVSENDFDFLSIVTGEQAYPKDQVTLNFAEGIAYEISKLETEIAARPETTDADKKELKKLEKKLAELYKTMEPYKIVFHLKGVSQEDVLQPIYDKIKEEYPDQKQTISGIPIDMPHKDFQYYYNIAEQHAHVEVVENFEGKKRVITLPEFHRMVTEAPASQYEKLTNAINKLSVEARFFEQQIDEDF